MTRAKDLKYVLYANRNGFRQALGEYSSLSDIRVYVGLFDDDVVIEIEEVER